MSRFRRWLWLLALLLPLVSAPAVAAQTNTFVDDVSYARYDVEIDVAPDGSFRVREIQEIYFNDSFSFAFAEIPRAFTTAIRDVQVFEGTTAYREVAVVEEPGTFSVAESAESIFVEWSYSPTTRGDLRRFVVEYVVDGGLWVYPDETRLEWRAVPADRSGFSAFSSRVTVNLPDGIAADSVEPTAFGPDFVVDVNDNQVVWRALAVIPDGQQFQILLSWPPGVVSAEPQPWQRQADRADLTYTFDQIAVDMTIQPDGTVDFAEFQSVTVTDGAMTNGSRTIPLAFVDDIDAVAVYEGDQPFGSGPDCAPYCFSTTVSDRRDDWISYDPRDYSVVFDQDKAGALTVRWEFPTLYQGESTTFEIDYSARGLIQSDETGQQIVWTVVFADRPVPVQAAALRVQLPPGVSPEQLTAADQTFTVVPGTTNQVELRAPGPIQPNQTWTVRLNLPPGTVAVEPPAWQQQFTAVRAEAQAAQEAAAAAEQQRAVLRARRQIMAGATGALIFFGGLATAFLTWYRRGRDAPTIGSYEYLSAPPSDMAPGIVAYLIDEKATTKGALSSLFHLATLGLLRVDLTGTLQLQRNYAEELTPGQLIDDGDGDPVAVPGHLVTLFNFLRPVIPAEETVTLDQIGATFRHILPRVYAEMAEEAAPYFTGKPDRARHRWLVTGQWLVILAAVATFCGMAAYVPELGAVALAPTVALGIVGLAFMVISRWMAQRTAVGAEETARWLGFRRYLKDIERHAGLAEAQAILDNFFAYAVALDVEESVLEHVEALGGFMPTWTEPSTVERLDPLPAGRPIIRRRRLPAPAPDGRQAIDLERLPGSGDALGEQVRRPLRLPSREELTLESMSSRLTRNLNNASSGLSDVLNTAVGTPQSDTPFKMIVRGTQGGVEMTWKATTGTLKVLGDIIEASAKASGGSGGYSGSSGNFNRSRSSSGRSSRPSSSSRSSSRSSGRSSSSRRSGGGGSRGFR